MKGTLEKIATTDIPDIRHVLGDCPEPVAQFFDVILSRSRARRPRNAREMKVLLDRLKKRLQA